MRPSESHLENFKSTVCSRWLSAIWKRSTKTKRRRVQGTMRAMKSKISSRRNLSIFRETQESLTTFDAHCFSLHHNMPQWVAHLQVKAEINRYLSWNRLGLIQCEIADVWTYAASHACACVEAVCAQVSDWGNSLFIISSKDGKRCFSLWIDGGNVLYCSMSATLCGLTCLSVLFRFTDFQMTPLMS